MLTNLGLRPKPESFRPNSIPRSPKPFWAPKSDPVLLLPSLCGQEARGRSEESQGGKVLCILYSCDASLRGRAVWGGPFMYKFTPRSRDFGHDYGLKFFLDTGPQLTQRKRDLQGLFLFFEPVPSTQHLVQEEIQRSPRTGSWLCSSRKLVVVWRTATIHAWC